MRPIIGVVVSRPPDYPAYYNRPVLSRRMFCAFSHYRTIWGNREVFGFVRFVVKNCPSLLFNIAGGVSGVMSAMAGYAFPREGPFLPY